MAVINIKGRKTASEPAGRASEPARRASEPAGWGSETAKRGSEPAESGYYEPKEVARKAEQRKIIAFPRM